MTNYKKLVEALNRLCQAQDTDHLDWVYGSQQAMHDAAAAIEDLQAKVDRLTKENMELAADRPEMEEVNGHWEWRKPNGEVMMPKRGEIVRCGECKYHLPETERTNPYCNRFHCMKPDDWYCADGERKVQE